MRGMRDALVAVIIFASLFSVAEHLGNAVILLLEQKIQPSQAGHVLLLIAAFTFVMSLLFTAMDAYMIWRSEQRQFRERMGFRE
jgi:amino acid transporter